MFVGTGSLLFYIVAVIFSKSKLFCGLGEAYYDTTIAIILQNIQNQLTPLHTWWLEQGEKNDAIFQAIYFHLKLQTQQKTPEPKLMKEVISCSLCVGTRDRWSDQNVSKSAIVNDSICSDSSSSSSGLIHYLSKLSSCSMRSYHATSPLTLIWIVKKVIWKIME